MEGFGAPSGLVVNIILSGEQAKQEFQTFSNQMSEIMRDLKENIQSTNTVLRNMFSATKVNNFKKAVDGVNKSLREYNELIANSPASKLAETPKATDTKAAAEKAAKTSGAMANTFFDTFRQQAGQIMNTSLTSHAIKGTQSIIRAFGTIASWIGRIRVIAQSAVKVIFNLIKSPFTLISNLLGKVSNALGAVFKAFEWVQYQFFMQFMNIWLFAKTIVPILETFINYNREIYNTWAIAQEEWGQGLETIKQKLLDINDIELDTKFETLREDIEKNMGSIESFDLGKLLSDLGLSLAMEYGRMPQDVASAFYDMASATVEFNDVLIFTEGAIKASVAGVTTLTTAVESGISTVYAFGKEMEDLNKIYDYQFATVKYGIIRYEELAQVMGRVYAPAASLSDTFENMNEMYATMAFATRVGLSPEMSGFGLARLYESLSDSRVINNLKKLNVEVFDSIGNFRGLQAILGDLIIATKGFSTATTQAMLSSLGFDMRARRVMRSLMNNYGAYMALLQEFGETPVDNISGSMDEAFQKMQESFAFRVDQLKATWESLKITFSESILDTLVYYVDNVALAMRGLLGWLKEGTITIGGFSVSMGVLVKHLSLFYVLFAGIATVAGALKVATTPMGVFLGMFMALVNSAGKNGLMFTALAERFEGLGIIIKTISDYVKIFFDLLKQDTPLKAFSTLLEMMFSDLSTILTSMPHINNVIQAFKKLFSAVQGLFDSSKYAQTITDFFKETGKIPQNYGEVIAQRFGNIFNSIGKAVKQMLVDALGLELDDSQSILAVVIPKVYRLIMDVFAGIFGKETGTFGLKDLFISIFETLGVVTRNSLGQAIVNKDFIRNVGRMFGNLLTESVKAAMANLPLFLTIAGFNISKEAFRSIFMMFNNLPALLSQTGLGSSGLGRGITFAGDFLKFYAVIEFFDAMFGTDLLKGLPPLIQTAIKVAVAGSGAFIASMIRAGLQGKLIGKVLQDSLGRAFKAGVVTIYATVVNIYTNGLNQPQGLSSPITTTVMSTAKGSISAYLALAIGAVAGVLG
ncbi:MAG: phage tail tape measure protein, partial [Clostridia bacterium]